VTEALQYAHEKKFIHRDIKPENMLIGERDAVLLSDFGIALISQSSRYQNTQDVAGTVAYMSPEQIQDKPRPASDQYSLGIVVYEWLCGDRPFRGGFIELCTQHAVAPPPPLRQKVPSIPPAVEQVVLTALAKDPHQRFASVQAFAIALEQASQTSAAPSETQLPTKLATQVSQSYIPTELVASMLPPVVSSPPTSKPAQTVPPLGTVLCTYCGDAPAATGKTLHTYWGHVARINCRSLVP